MNFVQALVNYVLTKLNPQTSLTVGIVSGFIWSKSIYGSFLGPKPLTVFPILIVWSVYGLLALGRYLFGWRGHQIALWGTIGFAAAIVAVGIHLH